jgi:type I secretion membrane fusion protein, HlyD family
MAGAAPRLRTIALLAGAALLLCVGVFAAWSQLAFLDSAVQAAGVVTTGGGRAPVYAPAGGALRSLLVREGDTVRGGQPLVRLDTTEVEALMAQLSSRHATVQAQLARLHAEQQDHRTLTFPPDLMARSAEPTVAAALEAQRRLFETRWRAYDSSLAIVGSRISQLREQAAAAEAQLEAVEKRVALASEDARNAAYLFDRGYERKSRLSDLLRDVEEFKGDASELRGTAAQAKQGMAGAEMEVVNLGDSRHAEVARDLEEARAQEADLLDRIRVAREAIRRAEIRAPQDGVVADLGALAAGASVAAGQPLMQILPTGDQPLVQAPVVVADAGAVRQGLPAVVDVRIPGRGAMTAVDGVVVGVAAVAQPEADDGMSRILVSVAPTAASLDRWRRLALTPGTPAEVVIVVGERRAITCVFETLRRQRQLASGRG